MQVQQRDGHRVIFTQAEQVELESFAPATVAHGEVGLRTLYTLMSPGTELTVLHRRYEPGGHWDEWVTFPFAAGYAAVGEVVDMGEGVDGLRVGDRVIARAGHASHHVVPAPDCTPIGRELDPTLAPWFALAKIAFLGARAAGHGLGDAVLVIGAGPVGQMAVRWANAAGARAVVVIDPVERRLALARRGGASAVIAKPVDAAAKDVGAALGGRGPDVVIDSTGNAEVFSAALTLVRTRGRVVILGDTGVPSRQHLTDDVLMRAVTVVGAHDSHSRWETDGDRGIHALFLHLVATGRFDLEGLNTHTFRPADCAAAYRLAAERPEETMGIVFDWTDR